MLRSGLAARDASGTLGRNLMRHCNAMMGYLFPFRTNPEQVNHKQICITDHYESVRDADGTALGIIQDMCMPPREVVRALGPPGFRWAAAVSAERIRDVAVHRRGRPSGGQRRHAVRRPQGRVRPAGRERAPRIHGGRTRRRDTLVRTARKNS